MESTLVHIVFFLNNGEKLKENLKHIDLLHNIIHIKNCVSVNTINFKNLLPNFYYIESQAFSEHN